MLLLMLVISQQNKNTNNLYLISIIEINHCYLCMSGVQGARKYWGWGKIFYTFSNQSIVFGDVMSNYNKVGYQ